MTGTSEFDPFIEKERATHEASLRAFDQFLTGLSASALSLSFVYYTTAYEGISVPDRVWLFIPIVAFLFSLLAVIVSQLTSAQLSHWKIREFRSLKIGAQSDAESARRKRDMWNRHTEYLNYGAIALLILGLVLFTFALFIQTTSKPVMDTKDQTAAKGQSQPQSGDTSSTGSDRGQRIIEVHIPKSTPTDTGWRGGQVNEGVTDSDKGWPPAKTDPPPQNPKKDK